MGKLVIFLGPYKYILIKSEINIGTNITFLLYKNE